MSDNKDITLQDSVNSLASIMYTGGYSPDGVHIEFRDALATPNFPMAFKKVVTTIVQEAPVKCCQSSVIRAAIRRRQNK